MRFAAVGVPRQCIEILDIRRNLKRHSGLCGSLFPCDSILAVSIRDIRVVSIIRLAENLNIQTLKDVLAGACIRARRFPHGVQSLRPGVAALDNVSLVLRYQTRRRSTIQAVAAVDCSCIAGLPALEYKSFTGRFTSLYIKGMRTSQLIRCRPRIRIGAACAFTSIIFQDVGVFGLRLSSFLRKEVDRLIF